MLTKDIIPTDLSIFNQAGASRLRFFTMASAYLVLPNGKLLLQFKSFL